MRSDEKQDDWHLLDFYNPETGNIEIPEGVVLRYKLPMEKKDES